MSKADAPEEILKSLKGSAQRYLRLNFYSNSIGGLSILLQAWLIAFIVNEVIINNTGLPVLTPYIIGLFMIFTIRFGVSFSASYYAGKAAIAVKASLRERLYKKIIDTGALPVLKKGSGALLNSMTDGVEAVGKYYQDYLPAQSMMRVLPPMILAVVFMLDWVSGLIMLLTAPLIPVFMILIGKSAESLNNKQWQKLARMGNHFMDAVQGLPTLRLFSAEKKEEDAIAKTAEEYRRDTMSVLRMAFLSSVTLEFFSTISIAVVAVFTGFRLMWGEMAFFNGFFVLLLAPEFYLPLRKMGAAYHAKMESVGAIADIAAILEAPLIREGQAKPNLSSIHLQFRHVSYSYDNNIPALTDINLDIKAKTKTALIGPSGAGKSTVASLLLRRIHASEGEIKVNDLPLNDIDSATWRNHISWIPQNPTLFFGTVMDNIRLGKKTATDEDIVSLCKKLGIHNFIKLLPKGYHTHVGEKGYGLSGGQIQRIAIARAFLRDAPLIVMDEPTASLDHETEKLIQKAMNDLTYDKTVIIIAHRLQTIRNVDNIIFLKDGMIIDSGPHEELLKQNADYAALIAQEINATIFQEVAA